MARSLDSTAKHLIKILRQGGVAANTLTDIFLTGRDEILKRIIKHAKTHASQAQLEALVHKSVNELRKVSADSLLSSGKAAGSYQAASSAEYLSVLGVTDPAVYKVTEKFIKKVFKIPFPDQNVSVDDLLTGTMANLDMHIVNATRQAIVSGDTIAATSKVLREASGMLGDPTLRRKAHALARTAISQTANATRYATFDGADEVAGVLYTATLDHRTSNVCKLLDGQYFPDKSQATVPPVHVSCRSTLVPVLKGEKLSDVKDQLQRPAVEIKSVAALKEKGLHTRNNRVRKPSSTSRSPLKGVSKKKYVTYEQWLKQQPVAYQREILGPKAYNKLKTTGSLRSALGVAD